MARYQMTDGRLTDTDLAQKYWDDVSDWTGKEHVSRATKSPWSRERLYLSRNSNYYIVTATQESGQLPSARWVEEQGALVWLLLMGHELPEELAHLAEGWVE